MVSFKPGSTPCILQLPQNTLNKRYLIRTLESEGAKPKKHHLRPNTIIIGLRINRQELNNRLANRAKLMVDQGLIKETKKALKNYGWDIEALRAPAYSSAREFIEGNIKKNEIAGLCVQLDLKLARKQRTWFKRNKSIHWVEKQIQVVDLITTFLNKQ